MEDDVLLREGAAGVDEKGVDIVHVILIVIQDAKISIRGNILMIDDDWKNIYCD